MELWNTWKGEMEVTITDDSALTLDDVCPACGGALGIIKATIAGEEHIFRLQCIRCSWVSVALPNPEA